MITSCICSPNAETTLRLFLEEPDEAPIGAVEVEFREVPYFLVSRAKWDPARGDMQRVLILGANKRGLVVDPDSASLQSRSGRRTLIPWNNVVSLTISRAAEGAEGSASV